MRTYWIPWMLLIQLTCPAIVQGSYVIKLKNGKEFITGRYWHEGRQVMFDTHEGVFGVDKAFVSSIDMSSKPLKIQTPDKEATKEQSKEAVARAEKEEKKPSKAPGPSEVKRDANDPIQKEFDDLKAQSQNLNGMLTSELIEYAKKLAAFKRKLQLEGKTNDYLREYGEIHEMGDAVEAALKSRR